MVNMTKCVQKVDSMIWRRVGDEIVIITPDGLSTHILNKTAAAIWDLCDGTNDTSTMTEVLYNRFQVSREVASLDVVETLDRMIELGLVIA